MSLDKELAKKYIESDWIPRKNLRGHVESAVREAVERCAQEVERPFAKNEAPVTTILARRIRALIKPEN